MSSTREPDAGPRVAPEDRFSNRVEAYARHRPRYPDEIVNAVASALLGPGIDAADVGAGTGIFSRQIAPLVRSLACIEPNAGMRGYAARYLAGLPNVRIADGRAEATGLPDRSVDAITAAQAFHWFDRDAARAEFERILRPGGGVALLWYDRGNSGTPFLEQYEAMLHEHSIDYREVDHRNLTREIIDEFFRPFPVMRRSADHSEPMDLDAIRGRLISSSYTPPPGHPGHEPLMAAAAELFGRHQRGGTVEFRYTTTAHIARFG